MPDTMVVTLSADFRKARSVSQTSSSFISKVPTITEPSGDAGTATGASVIDLCGSGTARGIQSQNAVLICPYGTGSDGNTFAMRVIGWKRLPRSAHPKSDMWIPIVLCEVTCTLTSSMPGIAGQDIGSGELFADTIVIVGTSGHDGVSIDIVSPANNVIANETVDMKGCQKLELSFSTGSVATDCNALISLY